MDWIRGRNDDGTLVRVGIESGRIAALDSEGDPAGPVVLPGFIDAHCHVMPMGLDMLKLSLAECSSHEEALDRIRDAVAEGEGWLHAVQYDQNRFPGARHIDRWQLDAVALSRPVLLRHANGHASVANSAALAAAGVAESAADPEGGSFGRSADGRLNGLLLERAHESVTSAAPRPGFDQMVEAVRRAQSSMAHLGITCASDMLTGRWDIEDEVRAYQAASAGLGTVRLRLYAIWSQVYGPRGIGSGRLRELDGDADPKRCRVAGIKIFADGAIASATAAVHGRFLTSGGQGQLIYEPGRLHQMVQTASADGWPVAVHAIGDRAVDHVLDAFEATGVPARHRLEHAMILSDAQAERIARLGCHVTMQPEFLLRFGAAYRNQLGPEAASRLKRIATLRRLGVPMSLNSDRPIVPGDPWDGIAAATVRPEGFDPAEQVGRQEALRLYTEGGALANGDAGRLGALAVGMPADLQTLEGRASKGTWRQTLVDGVMTARR
jgi:hypothetical protein